MLNQSLLASSKCSSKSTTLCCTPARGTRLAPVSASRHGGTLGHGTHRALERAPVSPVLQRARIALVPARSRC